MSSVMITMMSIIVDINIITLDVVVVVVIIIVVIVIISSIIIVDAFHQLRGIHQWIVVNQDICIYPIDGQRDEDIIE